MNLERDIRELVPQAGAMCLLERIVSADADSVICSTSTHRSPGTPLRRAGRLAALHLAEYGAQAMAVHGGLNGNAARALSHAEEGMRGLSRAGSLEEGDELLRLAHIEAIAETVIEADRTEIRKCRPRLEAALAATVERTSGEPRLPAAVPDEDLVNALAQYLPLEPLERQALLEREGITARCRGLIELLEMHSLTGGKAWKDRSVH